MPEESLKEPLQKGWCTTELPSPWDQAKPGRPMVMSHRAGGNEAPENTLAALRHAEKAGSIVMQMDILPTADGTPVVFHDINLKRATGVDEDIREVPTPSKLPLYKDVLEPLLPLDGAKAIHTKDFKDGQRIPTLSELLEAADEDTYLQLEFWEENIELIKKAAAIIRKASREHRVIIGAPQNAKIWQMCGQEMPEASRILPDSEVSRLYDQISRMRDYFGADSLSPVYRCCGVLPLMELLLMLLALLESHPEMSQVFKIYIRWLTGTISWWKPPKGTVFNIPLFTGWEQALAKKIPMSWWKKLMFQAMIRFNKWLYPRPKLFKWLNEHGIPVLVYILNRPQDWDVALKLEGITAIMTDSPSALSKYLSDRQ